MCRGQWGASECKMVVAKRKELVGIGGAVKQVLTVT